MPLPGSYNSPLRKWGVSGALSTSVWERSRRTRGQTRMGPLITCFMYDVWHVFEYLHVSEGDANREEKRGRKFRELCFLCQQRLSVNSCGWCNSRAEPVTPTVHIVYWSEWFAYIKVFKISDQVPICYSVMFQKLIFTRSDLINRVSDIFLHFVALGHESMFPSYHIML